MVVSEIESHKPGILEVFVCLERLYLFFFLSGFLDCDITGG